MRTFLRASLSAKRTGRWLGRYEISEAELSWKIRLYLEGAERLETNITDADKLLLLELSKLSA
jgi:hypothetical protein